MEGSLIQLRFLGIFHIITNPYVSIYDYVNLAFLVLSYTIDDHSCQSNISQIVNLYTFWFFNMPNVTAGYGSFSDLKSFFLGIS